MKLGDYFKNIIALCFGSFGAAGLVFVSQIISARVLGPHYFGVFNTALIIIGVLVPFANLGLPQYWLQIFSEDGENAASLGLYSGVILSLGNFLAILLFLVLEFYFDTDRSAGYLVLIFCFYLISLSLLESLLYLYQVERRYTILANCQFGIAFFKFIIPFSVWCYPGVLSVESSFFIINVGFFLFSIGAIWFSIRGMRSFWSARADLISGGTHLFFDCSKFFMVLRQSVPFFFAGIFYLIYFQGGVVFVRYLINSATAGQYGISFTVITGFVLVPGVIYQRFLISRLHEWALSDFEKLIKVYKFGNYAMLILGVVLSAVLYLISDSFAMIILDGKYGQVKDLLRILAAYIPLAFVNSNQGALLTLRRYNAYRVKCMGFVAAASLPINYFSIVNFGVKGACYALISCSLLLLISFCFCIHRYVLRELIK